MKFSPTEWWTMRSFLTVALVSVFMTAPLSISHADEGMWLFNDLPTQLLQERHGFDVTQEWADHLRLASVRFNSGGSGSIVSSDGLVLTNHHVASETLYKLSGSERNIMEDGFLAKSVEEELQAPDLELNQLVSIEDVTAKVLAAVTTDMDAEEAAKSRRAVIAKLESQSLEETGLRSDVVTLFGGAKYHLYRYKKYTDVRLVWAPETKAAFFGGDADNFEYPRYDLDATIMRIYEDGKPAKCDHYLNWRDKPVQENELIFVSGNPGRTQRIFTVDALRFQRDERMPYVLNFLRRKEVLLQQFSLNGKEEKRRARDELFGIQNARKAYTGMLGGLQNPAVMADKQQREDKVRQAADTQSSDPWKEIAQLQKEQSQHLGEVTSFRCRLYDIAETLNLMGAEDAKPNSERLREFGEAGRESLLQDLLSTAPIYDDLEKVKLADELARLIESRGGDDSLVKEVLDGKSPAERANQLIEKTNLGDVEFRKALVEGGTKAIMNAEDPMLELARSMETEYRRARTERESRDERQMQAYAKITEASVKATGTGTYPDATFSLRLAFGVVKGYQEDGKDIPIATDFAGAFQHSAAHDNEGDYELPESWYYAKDSIDLSKQLNFVSTADIIGGNSGSPVVDRDGALVGLIFDGNIQSLVADYLYTDQQGRATSVSAVGIREALEKIYKAKDLAASLGR